MSVQNYETDVLQEHVDSTPVLIERLEQWSKGVHVIQEYVHGYVQVHQGISHNLEKTLRSIGEAPSFPDLALNEGHDPAMRNSSLAAVFEHLQTNTNVLLQRSVATGNGIKSSILPQLDQIVAEIDKHYKTLRTQGGKGIREIEKSRDHTQRMIEHLGRVSSSFGSRMLSHQDDPYVLHRRVQAAIAEQVGRENTQAEAALNVQKSFASLETHIMQTIRHSLASLASLNDGYDNSEREINDAITGLFRNVDLEREWQVFTKMNSQQLVPTTNFQRDPNRVTFVNKNHPSTQPLVSGTLSRKSTVLKNWNQAFYAVVPSGFLHQLKSADPYVEAAPELSLFLPDCQLSRSSKPGESILKIVGKDTQKKIGGRHKYVFKTTSPRELDVWYNAIARITGNIGGDDDIDSPADGEGDGMGSMLQSPAQPQSQAQQASEPPTGAFANTSLDEQTAAAPSAPATSSGVPSAATAPSGAANSSIPFSGANSPRSSGHGAALASAPVTGPVPDGVDHQQPAPVSRFENQAPPSYQQGSPRQMQQTVPANQISSQQLRTQHSTAVPASAQQQRVPSNPATQVPREQPASTVPQSWTKEVQEVEGDQTANRNSFLSENDPFKSF